MADTADSLSNYLCFYNNNVHVGLGLGEERPHYLSLPNQPPVCPLYLSFLQQDAASRTQSTEMFLRNEDGSEKESTPVKNQHSYTDWDSHAPPALLILLPLPPLSSASSPQSDHSHNPSCQVSMATPFLWKLSSQKLGFFLVSFGFIWGMMLLHFTIQQRASHENSAVLRQQILDLSKRYIKALAEENQSVMDGPYVGTMTAYGE